MSGPRWPRTHCLVVANPDWWDLMLGVARCSTICPMTSLISICAPAGGRGQKTTPCVDCVAAVAPTFDTDTDSVDPGAFGAELLCPGYQGVTGTAVFCAGLDLS